LWLAHGFLIGEPTTHIDGRLAFTPYVTIGGKYYERSASLASKPIKGTSSARHQSRISDGGKAIDLRRIGGLGGQIGLVEPAAQRTGARHWSSSSSGVSRNRHPR
jgi:hypothetical protein